MSGTPCTVSARSCVDLESQRAWLIEDGKVVRGPVKISSGGAGKETPLGHSFRVYRKEADHKSQEFKLRERPAGADAVVGVLRRRRHRLPQRRPGARVGRLIHLAPADAKAWFDDLQVGDQVQVVEASEENAARSGSGH